MRFRSLLVWGVLVAVAAAAVFALWRRHARRVEAVAAALPAVPEVPAEPEEFGLRLRTLTKRVELDPSDLAAAGDLAGVYVGNARPAQARALLDVLVRLEPRQARWAYWLAEARRQAGDVAGAETALRMTVERDPAYVPAWLKLGDACAERRAWADAAECYRRADLVLPGDLRVAVARIRLAARAGNQGDPRVPLARLIEAHSDLRSLHEFMATLQAAGGDEAAAGKARRAAAAATNDVTSDDPWLDELWKECFQVAALEARAAQWRRERRFEEAIQVLGRAISMAPEEPEPRLQLADIYETMEAPAEVRKTLEAAVRACPRDVPVRVRLAAALRSEGHKDEAVMLLRAALRTAPGDAALHLALGRALRDSGRAEEALAELDAALARDPRLAEAHYQRGVVLVEKGRRDEARTEVRHALELEPEHPGGLALAGTLAIDAKDRAEAERVVGRLYANQPDDANARVLFAALQLMKGNASADAGELDAADRWYQAGLAAAPEFGPLLREGGALALRRGQSGDAAALLERYVKLEPNDLRGYTLLGRALQEAGRRAEARRVLQRGRSLAQRAGDQTTLAEIETLLGER